MIRRLSLASLTAIGVLTAPALAAAQETKSATMAQDCRGTQNPNAMRETEAWMHENLKAFEPAPGAAPSLRLMSWNDNLVQEALAAKDGIVQVCASYLAGNTPRDVADNTLSGFEQTLRDFVDHLGRELTVLASAGNVSQMPQIREAFTQVAAVGRQDALLGNEAAAEHAHQVLIQGLTNFSRAFTTTCYDQEFDPQIAIELGRQNDTVGTGIDVTPCAKRKFTARVPTNYLFESCSEFGVGEWRVTWDFGDRGRPQDTFSFGLDPESNSGHASFKVRWATNYGVEYQTHGDATLTVLAARNSDGTAGERVYHLKGKYSVDLTKGQGEVAPLAKLMNAKPGGKGGFDQDVTVSRKPCKSIDDNPQGPDPVSGGVS